MRFEDLVWKQIEQNPFITLDRRTDKKLELIGRALCGDIKPEAAIQPIEKYLSQYSNTLFYLN